ncbi:hypothetical protein TNCV_3416541 [Trichonephila clavipes]|nr:hypothetical protein TNCV_3416541 [Trichonephila clavipes]
MGPYVGSVVCAEKGKWYWRLQRRESPLNWLCTDLLKVGNWADQQVEIALGFALWIRRVSEKLSMTGLWSDESSGMDSMVKGKLKLLMRAKSNVLAELYPYLCSIGVASFLVQSLHENPAGSFAEVSMEEEVGERQRLTVAEIGQKLFQMAEIFEQTRHTEKQKFGCIDPENSVPITTNSGNNNSTYTLGH